MNIPPQRVRAGAGASLTTRGKRPVLRGLLMLLLTLCAVRAAGPDEDYLAVYGIINQAEALSASGKTGLAHAKYAEAQAALVQFQRANPTWNSRIVSFRLNYLAEKLAATLEASIASEASPVRLLGAGSEPRSALRLHPAVGDQQTLSMNLNIAMTTSVAGNAMPAMNLPAMLLTMEVVVKEISADGVITYQVVFSDATVAADTNVTAAVAEAMKSSLANVRGMTGTGKMSDHGIIKSMEMKLPGAGDPQLSQTLEQMKESFASAVTPLPEEPIGPGAKWEYKNHLKSQGMTIDQTMNYELVAIEGNRLTLRSTVAQKASNQKIQSPAMPGLKLDLNQLNGNGTGSTTFDLAHIMPTSAALAQKTEISMGMNVGQQKQAMDMKMDLNVTIQSK